MTMAARSHKAQAVADKRQIKRIHTLSSKMELPDETYRKWLQERYAATSSKQLTFDQAEDFIAVLEYFGVRCGYWEADPNRTKYGELAGRPHMASPPQLRMVESMWAELTRPATDEEKDATLRGFLFKYFKVSDLRFLDSSAVNKAILALKAMKVRKWEGSPKSPQAAKEVH